MQHQLNYQHLYYFWTVGREGGITAAGRALRLSSATISVQVRQLEAHYEQQLLRRVGRGVKLTEVGHVVFRYADSIFSVGQELEDYLEGRPGGGPLRLDVGVAPVLPKLVTWRLLEPVYSLPEPCHVVCREESPEALVSDLLLHQVDVVLSDTPLGGDGGARLFNHPLGSSKVAIVATQQLASGYSAGFPQSLDGAPFLLPVTGTAMRRSLDSWMGREGIRPRIVAEFDDGALLKVAGAHGLGCFPVPSVVLDDAEDQYGVTSLGLAAEVEESFYAVSAERQIAHPAVEAIASAARSLLSASG